jgi:hypothetical protein
LPDRICSIVNTHHQDEAAKLIRRLERGIPKRPAAESVRRAVKRKPS